MNGSIVIISGLVVAASAAPRAQAPASGPPVARTDVAQQQSSPAAAPEKPATLEKPGAPDKPAPPARLVSPSPSSPEQQNEARFHISQMERLLEGAVEHGAKLIHQRLQAIVPAEMLVGENA